MSKILSPNPIQIGITFHPLTGKLDFQTSQPLPLEFVVQTFAKITIAIIENKARQALTNPGVKPDANPIGGAPNGS